MAESVLAGRNVLVTGGTGAFGQAFVRRALDAGVGRIAVYSRSEVKQAVMREAFADDRVRYMIGDVRDLSRLDDAMRGIEFVVHSAALKRVESCEGDPDEAIDTNIMGSRNVARAARTAGATKAVMLGTDKAASPDTAYGLTKAMAERAWIGANVYGAATPTRYACTRYGNILNSTGSVVPIWRAQAAAGKPLTITDNRMDRFLMKMDEGIDLVLTALKEMVGGETFLPVARAGRMVDLAEAVAPGHPTVEVGIRGDEKLHELLVSENEIRRTFARDGHYVIQPAVRTWAAYIPEPGVPVPEEFMYRSDSVGYLSVGELRALIA
jgi:UDP-N-acetylglucosamine 4,6-dehydratase